MVVTTNLHLGEGLVRGNVFSLRRYVTNLPSGITISSAKHTQKTYLTDPESSAVIALTATVEDSGSSGTGSIRFDFSAVVSSAPTAGVLYFFDIQLTMSDGTLLTLESGQTQWTETVTTT